MGVLDKIKNALFEVEYVEVDEPQKPEVKKKHKKEHVVHEEKKPIAKKVVLPNTNEKKVDKLEEEDLKDDNFEVRPKDEKVKATDDFKFMDDSDFKSEDYKSEEPKIVKVIDNNKPDNISYDYNNVSRDSYNNQNTYSENDYNSRNNVNTNSNNKVDSKPYGLDEPYKIPTYEYGSYEKKEEKKVFKPSPIISPIYGILDKNYKKEDVVQKKEVRLTSSYTRTNVSVDDVRNKALGVDVTDTKEEDITFNVDDGEDDNLLVDLTDESDKPEVKELTMGDALEYFQDLGLEYNVDYVDASKNRIGKKTRETESRVKVKEEERKVEAKPSISEVLKKEAPIKNEDNNSDNDNNITVIKNEDESVKKDSDDDNLFDLIDSMYEEKGD